MGFFTPCPFLGHRCLGDGLDAFPYLGLGQPVSAVPSWVISATHVADLVNSALEGRNSAADEGPQEVIRHQPFSLPRDDEVVDTVDLEVRLPGIEIPVVLLCGGAEYEFWQVEQIGIRWALHVEEGSLPLVAGFQTMYPRKDGGSPGYNSGSSAWGQRLRECLVVLVRDALLPKLEVLGPQIYCRPEAEISLGESGVSRESSDGIGGEMVWLKSEFVEEGSEKRARGESEAALEVRDEDYAFAGF